MKGNIDQLICQALKEDQCFQDSTARILIGKDEVAEGYIICKEEAVVCGLKIVQKVFKKIDPKLQLRFWVKDGNRVKKNTKVVVLKGRARSILSGERVALNFLSLLSGIATLTHKFVKLVSPFKVKIMDTRKTTPTLRSLEKMAVRYGGGFNHRYHLKDMILIKDNHRVIIEKLLTIPQAIQKVRRKTKKPIEIEVNDLSQFKQALDSSADIIMLDNMSLSQMKKAVSMKAKRKKKCILEVSGGIHLKNIQPIAQLGIDRISIGALTHSPKAIDFSLEIQGS